MGVPPSLDGGTPPPSSRDGGTPPPSGTGLTAASIGNAAGGTPLAVSRKRAFLFYLPMSIESNAHRDTSLTTPNALTQTQSASYDSNLLPLCVCQQ